MTDPAIPPVYDVDSDDLDEEQHPTGAWTVGERLDPEVAERLRQLIDKGRA